LLQSEGLVFIEITSAAIAVFMAFSIGTSWYFCSGYPLQAFTTLRFTSLRSGLSASIRQLFSSLFSIGLFPQNHKKTCLVDAV
jgi:hypothetical protein